MFTAGRWTIESFTALRSSPFALAYGYDVAGRVRSAWDGTGVQYNYDYDGALRLTALSSSLSDATHPPFLLSGVQYGPFGTVTGTLASRLTDQATYDAQGRRQTYTVTAPGSRATVGRPTAPSSLSPISTKPSLLRVVRC